MITNEKEMEEYIISDVAFPKHLEDTFGLKNVKFVGNQVHIGKGNIIDILYKGVEDVPEEVAEGVLIVVELKFRTLEPKDYSQIGRYMIAVHQYQDTNETKRKYKVKGMLLGTSIGWDIANTFCLVSDEDISVNVVECEFNYMCVSDSLYRIDINGQTEDCFENLFIEEELKNVCNKSE